MLKLAGVAKWSPPAAQPWLGALAVTTIWHLAEIITSPDHGCISSCHYCEFGCIKFLYAARTSVASLDDEVARGVIALTLPLRLVSLACQVGQVGRTIRVPSSFLEKTDRISQQLEQILS